MRQLSPADSLSSLPSDITSGSNLLLSVSRDAARQASAMVSAPYGPIPWARIAPRPRTVQPSLRCSHTPQGRLNGYCLASWCVPYSQQARDHAPLSSADLSNNSRNRPMRFQPLPNLSSTSGCSEELSECGRRNPTRGAIGSADRFWLCSPPGMGAPAPWRLGGLVGNLMSQQHVTEILAGEPRFSEEQVRGRTARTQPFGAPVLATTGHRIPTPPFDAAFWTLLVLWPPARPR